MTGLFLPALCLALLLGQELPDPPVCGSYLYEPCYCIDKCLHGTPTSYLPQPGDIMLRMDDSRFWAITHNLAFAFAPHGSGVVVQRPDGTLGILEAGPNDIMWCGVPDLLEHLHEYEVKGEVWIRKRKCPITEEQSACLTAFACKQDGKLFALQRLGLQLTPFRTRGPLRTYVMGKPHGDRFCYFCSELVTEALVAACLVDRETARPSATYPHDLFTDHSYNLYLRKHFTLANDWEPPARWVSHP
jgi:hypothetical protein